jgi:addiction module HigA family antidote
MGITQYRLAKDIGVPAMRINKIVRGERGISADTGLRLARYFGVSVDFWTGIQVHYDTEMAKMNLGSRLEKEVKVLVPAALKSVNPLISSIQQKLGDRRLKPQRFETNLFFQHSINFRTVALL